MNFELTQEQIMLRDSVVRFVQKNYEFSQRQKLNKTDKGYSSKYWLQFSELGWLSIPFSEEHGGFGGNIVDIAVLMQEFGKGLVLEPYVTTIVMGGGFLVASNHSSCIEQVIEGKCQLAVGLYEPQSRFEWQDINTTVEQQTDGSFILNGTKSIVANAPNSDWLIVSAKKQGTQGEEGISLFMIPNNHQGVNIESYLLMDGQRVADVRLNQVNIPADHLVGHLNQGAELIESVIQKTTIALCAEALGIMETLQEMTVKYVKTRKQFGTAIGSFQTIQHRLVDTFMACEQTKSMLYRTLCDFIAGEETHAPRVLAKSVHALKMMVGKNGKHLGDEAIQLHGGIGMTDELSIGHYVKRLMMINITFGNESYHQQKIMDINFGPNK